MKLLFITHNVPRYPGDAAGSFILRLAVALQQAGADIEIVAPGAAGLPSRDVQEGVRIRRVSYASDKDMTLAYAGTMAESVRQSWSARWALFGMLRHLRREVRTLVQDAASSGHPFDAVHAHWWFPSGVIAWSAGVGKGAKPPLVITMHGSDVRLAQSIRASHRLMRAVLRRARAITAVSSWLAGRARALAPDVQVDVAPMPVDVHRFAPPADHAARSGILFVGRLNAQKGLDELLQAVSRIVVDHDHTVTLDVVGDGPDGTALREQAAQLGMASRVRWHGALAQPDLVPLYQAACVVAVPSIDEGLGLVAVEAQLCGTPVVAYDSGGLPDVVNTQSGGTLVPPHDIARLADALARFVSADATTAVARETGARARAAMLATFAPDAVAAHYLRVYRTLRGGPPS